MKTIRLAMNGVQAKVEAALIAYSGFACCVEAVPSRTDV